MSKPIVDPRAEALQYLEKNKINILFDILGSRIAREKPENPNDFLLAELQKIQQQKSANLNVTLFTKSEISTMFSTFDITGKGYVTAQQYYKALQAIGINSASAGAPKSDRLNRDTFVELVYAEIAKKAF